jgi:zinc protease
MFDRLDMERSFAIYRDRFADASDFTFFLVGSFTPEQVRPLVERYVASLPNLGRVERGVDRGIRPPRGVVRKVVQRGVEPRGATQIVFTGQMAFERTNVLALQSLADVLRLRLRESLREDLGGTYGVDVRSAVAREPVGQYQFSLGFGANPDRIEELSRVTFEEISRLKVDGPTEEELTKVREMQFRAREVDLRENHYWITQLMLYSQYGWDPALIPAVPLRPTSVTAALVRDAARRYLDEGNYIQVSLLPEIGAAAAANTAGEPPR